MIYRQENNEGEHFYIQYVKLYNAVWNKRMLNWTSINVEQVFAHQFTFVSMFRPYSTVWLYSELQYVVAWKKLRFKLVQKLYLQCSNETAWVKKNNVCDLKLNLFWDVFKFSYWLKRTSLTPFVYTVFSLFSHGHLYNIVNASPTAYNL